MNLPTAVRLSILGRVDLWRPRVDGGSAVKRSTRSCRASGGPSVRLHSIRTLRRAPVIRTRGGPPGERPPVTPARAVLPRATRAGRLTAGARKDVAHRDASRRKRRLPGAAGWRGVCRLEGGEEMTPPSTARRRGVDDLRRPRSEAGVARPLRRPTSSAVRWARPHWALAARRRGTTTAWPRHGERLLSVDRRGCICGASAPAVTHLHLPFQTSGFAFSEGSPARRRAHLGYARRPHPRPSFAPLRHPLVIHPPHPRPSFLSLHCFFSGLHHGRCRRPDGHLDAHNSRQGRHQAHHPTTNRPSLPPW